eukprot:1316451-Pyramimonas_sp.AAC.1
MQALRNGADAAIATALRPILAHFRTAAGPWCTSIKFSELTSPCLTRIASAQFESEEFNRAMQLSADNKDK